MFLQRFSSRRKRWINAVGVAEPVLITVRQRKYCGSNQAGIQERTLRSTSHAHIDFHVGCPTFDSCLWFLPIWGQIPKLLAHSAARRKVSVLLSSSSARAGARALQPPDNPSIEVAAT